jgi:hypothetical protein
VPNEAVLPCACLVFFRRMQHFYFWAGAGLLWSTTGFAGESLVYFGTCTGTAGKGIYVSRFDSVTGKLTAPALAAETKNPTFQLAN